MRKKATQKDKDRYLKAVYSLQKDMLNKDVRDGVINDKFLAKFGMAFSAPDEPFYEVDKQKVIAPDKK
jgi:hypothetical protein